MKVYFENFRINYEKTKTIETWRFLLFQFYFYRQINILRIEYQVAPLYANFKKTWANKFGKHFRFLMVIIPVLLLIRLILDYSSTWKWWFWTIACSPIIVLATINFIRDIICKLRIKAHNASIRTDLHVISRYGRPGGGKTSSLFYDMKILADLMWAKICREYKLLEPYLNEIQFWPQKIKEDALEIIEAFNFYTNSGTYPCLWTSAPAFVDGVPANRITANHLLQREKLPYGAVVVLDEVSLILPQDLFRNRLIELKEMAKFPRHLGDFHFATTEQGKTNMLKDFRDSAAENKCMVEQRWILKPNILIWIYNFLLDHITKLTKYSTVFFRVFNSINNSIGYRKYIYYDAGTEDREIQGKLKSFILPPYLNITYDSRAFKNAYRCKDQKLKVSSWNNLRLSKQEIDEIFTKELNERMKSKAEKRAEEKIKAKEKKEND